MLPKQLDNYDDLFSDLFLKFKQELSTLSHKLSEIDLAIQDYLHHLEMSNFNYHESNTWSIKLKLELVKRREIKDRISAVTILQTQFKKMVLEYIEICNLKLQKKNSQIEGRSFKSKTNYYKNETEDA